MIAFVDRLYAGRLRPIIVAVGLTVAVAFVFSIAAYGWPNRQEAVFLIFVSSIFVGLPAFFGITLLMIPAQMLFDRLGRASSSLGVIVANVSLVLVLCMTGMLPSSRSEPMLFYAAFAFLAAVIWLLSDWALRKPSYA